jgi:hypothetical protein
VNEEKWRSIYEMGGERKKDLEGRLSCPRCRDGSPELKYNVFQKSFPVI